MASLASGQIAYLEHQTHRLYGEVIQIVSERQLCWMRPLLLADYFDPDQAELVCRFHEVSDLLWPLEQFQPALDVELMPLLAQAGSKQDAPSETSNARSCSSQQHLRGFIDRLWQGKNAVS